MSEDDEKRLAEIRENADVYVDADIIAFLLHLLSERTAELERVRADLLAVIDNTAAVKRAELAQAESSLAAALKRVAELECALEKIADPKIRVVDGPNLPEDAARFYAAVASERRLIAAEALTAKEGANG